MDPSISDLISKMTDLSIQVAAMQANIEWLTKLIWGLFGLNAASFLGNSYLNVRNNQKKGK